ncbi:GNAT family N-acetyltransferase [Spirosoma aureum]|uniref:GNAT family N-acetyltransferase n=1 Tax=Spirosoma aureum TaxID=2692134 RepID=A0A6G9AQE4_9BACT|nr:GNAT family N-acetyltransferase [Spirosoma aureum]QIP14554.1 GNAT family N-acetyltransferase [Spirosoma aureum]
MVDHQLTYRTATASDIPNIARLTLKSYHDYKAVLTPINWARMEANLSNENLYADLLGKATTFVCEANCRLVGVIFLMPNGNPTSIFPADWSYIRLLGVDPDYRGLRIGRKLTELCIHHAKSTGEIGIALHTSEFMNAARSMYEELGFRQAKELPPMFDKRYWLYKLSFSPIDRDNQ